MTLTSDYGTQRACLEGLGALLPKGIEPIYYSILFYSIPSQVALPVVW